MVPTSAVVCRSNEKYREFHGEDPSPQIPGASCMLLFLALWLENVTVPDVLYEQERFLVDATYARYLADLNLFAYLIDHRDKRKGNFLVSMDDDLRRAFSIDNGMAFDPFWYNYFVQHWNEIRVAALRRESVDRLRRWTRRDLEGLRVVQQFELKADGMLVESEPGPPLSEVGFAARDGVVQFGLGAEEVDALWARIQSLLAEVDAGRIPVL